MELARQNNQIALTGRLNEIAEQWFKEFLLKEYNKLMLKNGQNAPPPESAAMIANELYNHLTTSWPGVKVEWLSTAFNNGITGEYGDFANISFRLMVSWVNAYRGSMSRSDFGIAEEPMATKERADFVLDGLRKRNSDISKIGNI